MSKLLSANFMRLKRDKFFWIGIAFMFAAGVFFPVMKYADMKQTGAINNIDKGFFGCTLFIGIVMAVFCSLFIGTEYSDGTMRNKIVIGHKRAYIYLANFITSAIVSIAMSIMFFFPFLCIGVPLFGFFEMDIKLVLLFSLAALVLAVVFSSIFTLISMLNRNKAITAIICILLAVLFLVVGTQMNQMLDEPKTNMGLTMTEAGQKYEELPNPKYLGDKERNIVQFFYDFIPGGQVVQCMSLDAINIARLPIYSLIITILTTGAGVIFFKKKDLK